MWKHQMQSDVVWFDSVKVLAVCFVVVRRQFGRSFLFLLFVDFVVFSLVAQKVKSECKTKEKTNDDEEDVMLLPNYIVRL